VSEAGHPAGHRRSADLPAARLAEVRQLTDPLCVLVCEPDPDVLRALLDDLVEVNVKVVVSSDGARALLDIGLLHPELLLLAADLPVLSASDVIRTLRVVSDTTVVVGAAEGQVDLVSAAVAAGADRVLQRPYAAAELRAVLLTQRTIVDLDSVVLRAGDLTVNPLAYEVRLGGRLIPMPGRELEVLVYLMRHPDRIVSVAELRTAVWRDEDMSPRSNTVAVTVMRLRSRLADERRPEMIRTVRRRGYRFYPPESSHEILTAPAQLA
jgi:Response regulators consisting of a CheY-like receiver domain and a winged-helix DNA-binding domain